MCAFRTEGLLSFGHAYHEGDRRVQQQQQPVARKCISRAVLGYHVIRTYGLLSFSQSVSRR